MLYSFFEGRWDFKRTISDGSEMRGSAVFSPHFLEDAPLEDQSRFSSAMPFDHPRESRFLYYEEEGLFYTHRDILEFYRDYIFAFCENNAFSIYFSHNKMLHNLFMTFQDSHTQTSHHQCLSDHYEGQFEKINENTFQLFYRVKGPRKDYTLKTLYERRSFDEA